ncbi:hypothetical protein [uncultured Parabacteroides sp.]|uniref:hypothetical protein n=1 Tax=uncultured Parabacteroides sp. TaxID=512312 RepID=UPI0025DBB7A7|nr:hypothetical protein [uncultured Parabacteroides sp.]
MMKLKFKVQQYQTDAVKNVVKVLLKNIHQVQTENNIRLSNDVVDKLGHCQLVACAEKLFEQLSTSEVKYGKIDSYDTLMSLVK